METAARDAVELRHQHRPDSVHKLSKRTPIPAKHKNVNKACFHCDRPNHTPDQCHFKEETCRFCSKKGHIERACLSKKAQQNRNQSKKHISNKKSVKSVEEEELLTVSINTVKRSDVISVTPRIEGKHYPPKTGYMNNESLFTTKIHSHTDIGSVGKHLQMELDTGSAISVIPIRTYRELFSHKPLSETKTRLKTYSGETITPAGIINVLVNYEGQEHNLDLFVVKKDSPYLFGRAWLKHIKLDWNSIKFLQTGKSTEDNVQELLQKYSQIFTAESGKVKGMKASLTLKENAQLKVDQYPLPRIQDIFSSLAGGQKFTKIDLWQAYNQLEMSEDSKSYLTINTHKGLYSYNRLVFGIAASPSIWQRTMDQILKDIPNTSCILDDIIITGKSDEEHLKTLDTVLQRLQDYNLRVNRDKCSFFQEEITYCGQKINANGLHKTQDKIEAVINAPVPENVTQLRAFLGLVNYYSHFLPNMASVLHPLYQLLKKDRKYAWTAAAQNAFDTVKEMITSDTVLTHYNPDLPVKLACDSSAYGLGAVISHVMENGEERPIAFASRTLNAAEKNYAQIRKEALSLVWGVKKFHCMLFARKFTLVTDHQH